MGSGSAQAKDDDGVHSVDLPDDSGRGQRPKSGADDGVHSVDLDDDGTRPRWRAA